MSAVLGNINCACGHAVPIVEGKGGTLNGRCPNPRCGAQTLVRSPAAVETWKAAFRAGKPPPGHQAAPDDKKKEPAKPRGGSGLVIP